MIIKEIIGVFEIRWQELDKGLKIEVNICQNMLSSVWELKEEQQENQHCCVCGFLEVGKEQCIRTGDLERMDRLSGERKICCMGPVVWRESLGLGCRIMREWVDRWQKWGIACWPQQGRQLSKKIVVLSLSVRKVMILGLDCRLQRTRLSRGCCC